MPRNLVVVMIIGLRVRGIMMFRLGSMNNSNNNSNVGVLLEHMRTLTGIWPPEIEDALPEQKCSL